MTNRPPHPRALLVLRALALLVGNVQAAPDAKLLAAATGAQPALIETLKSLVMIESGSGDVAGLAKMATLVDERLKALGFKTERRKASVGAGADIVIGTLAGTGRRKIMLQAHMDTVYQSGVLQSQPYKQDGNKLYGPRHRRRQGRHRGDPARAADPEGRRLEGLRDPDRAVQPRRGGRLGRLGRPDLGHRRPARHGAVVRADRGEGGREGRIAAARRGRRRAGDDGGQGACRPCRRGARTRQQRDPGNLAPDAADPRSREGHPRRHLELDQCGLEQGTEPDSRTGGGKGRRAHHRARRRGEAECGAAGQDREQPADPRHGDDREAGDRPPRVSRRAVRARAGRAGAGDLQGDRPRTRPGADDRRWYRCGVCAPLRQGHGGRKLRLAGFGYHARDEYIELDSIVPRLYLVTRLLTEIGKR